MFYMLKIVDIYTRTDIQIGFRVRFDGTPVGF